MSSIQLPFSYRGLAPHKFTPMSGVPCNGAAGQVGPESNAIWPPPADRHRSPLINHRSLLNAYPTMAYCGPIDLDQLFNPQPIWESGECPYSFLAFPVSTVIQHGVPEDQQAQEYIAAVQAEGIPVGIWLATPVEGTAYAVVRPADIRALHRTVEMLTDAQRFSDHFAAELSERLFRENSRV